MFAIHPGVSLTLIGIALQAQVLLLAFWSLGLVEYFALVQVAQGDQHASLRAQSHLEIEANETFGPGRIDMAGFSSWGQLRPAEKAGTCGS